MIRSTFSTTTLLLIIGTMIFAGCGGSSDNNSSENNGRSGNENIPAVEAVKARYGSLPLSERLSGTVRAENQVSLHPELSAPIIKVYVENGDYVEEGDPIVQLKDDQYKQQVQQAEAGLRINKARLKQAKARLNELRAQYNRTKQLADKEMSSDLELETIQAQLESAEADVELAEAQLAQAQSQLEQQRDQLQKTVIRAPISGTVGQRNAEVGMQVNSNTQLFTIGDLDNLRVEIYLTEKMLNRLEVGQTTRIIVERNNEQRVIRAELARISPFLNNVTRSTEAEIDVNNKQGLLKPGMYVQVDVLYGESEQATIIPKSSLYTHPTKGEDGVYIVKSLDLEVDPIESSDDDQLPALTEPLQVEFQPIDVLAEGRMELGVTGINSGDWIVTVGQDLLSGGKKQARVRTISWDKILALQEMKPIDLLNTVLQEGDTTTTDTIEQSTSQTL